MNKNGLLERQKIDIEESIQEIEEPIKNLLKDISIDINNGNFGGIIVDDGSGRIPGLVFNNIVKSIYKTKGYEAINNYFLGTKNINIHENNKMYFDKLLNKLNTNKKILIVTDGIATGETLFPLLETLENKDIKFIVVSIGKEENIQKYPEYFFLKKRQDNIYYGMNDLPILDSSVSNKGYNLPGVIKSSAHHLYKALRKDDINKGGELFDRGNFLLGRKEVQDLYKKIERYYIEHLK